jgi:hypothetical protein
MQSFYNLRAQMSNVPLPISREIDALAALHRQRRYGVHLIAQPNRTIYLSA